MLHFALRNALKQSNSPEPFSLSVSDGGEPFLVAGSSAAWLAHLTGGQGVGGSNPLCPTNLPQKIKEYGFEAAARASLGGKACEAGVGEFKTPGRWARQANVMTGTTFHCVNTGAQSVAALSGLRLRTLLIRIWSSCAPRTGGEHSCVYSDASDL